jgi:hypothetical protein
MYRADLGPQREVKLVTTIRLSARSLAVSRPTELLIVEVGSSKLSAPVVKRNTPLTPMLKSCYLLGATG